MFNSSTMLRIAAVAALVTLGSPAQAAPVYTGGATLTPGQEVQTPPVESLALGVASVTVDDKGDADGNTFSISWDVTFSGLTPDGDGRGLRIAHFHGPAPLGENAPPTIDIHGLTDPQGATEGTLTGSADLSAVQLQQILDGLWYINVHSYVFPAGEIRGQVSLTAVDGGGEVPLPGTLGLLGLAGMGLAAARRRKG